jgi:hypothetical protein
MIAGSGPGLLNVAARKQAGGGVRGPPRGDLRPAEYGPAGADPGEQPQVPDAERAVLSKRYRSVPSCF